MLISVKTFQFNPIWINNLIQRLIDADVVGAIEIVPNKSPRFPVLERFFNRYGGYSRSELRFEELELSNFEGASVANETLDLTSGHNTLGYSINVPFDFWYLKNIAPKDNIFISLDWKGKALSSKIVGTLNTDRTIASKLQVAFHLADLIYAYFVEQKRHRSEKVMTEKTSSNLLSVIHRVQSIVKGKLSNKTWKIVINDYKDNYHPNLSNHSTLLADPFLFQYKGRRVCFFEQQVAKAPAVIMALDLESRKTDVAIAEDYHLSYPHVFEEDGKIYMIPESSANKTLDLYECIDYPFGWKKVHTFFKDLKLHDATLIKHREKYWLFAVQCADDRMNPWVDLHIYHSDSLFGDWKSHKMNPVVSDVRIARCGGAFLRRGNTLLRVCQDSSGRYGKSISFRLMEELTESTYSESPVEGVIPLRNSYSALHTYNELNNEVYCYDYIK